MHAIVLRIRVADSRGIDWITDSLGECARELESYEADHVREEDHTELGLIPDPDDPGRFAWEIVTESYPTIAGC